MEPVFWDGGAVITRTVVVGVLAYGVLLGMLRLSGKRTLSKMNAFDFIVTIALGSTLASVLVSKDVALAQGAVAFGVLVGLQFAVTWASVRAPWVRRLLTGEPSLLLHRGAYVPSAMRRARVVRDEVLAAVRSAGLADVDDVEAVVLETDGSFSVVPRTASGVVASSLSDVARPEDGG